jgi:hypothetical protein
MSSLHGLFLLGRKWMAMTYIYRSDQDQMPSLYFPAIRSAGFIVQSIYVTVGRNDIVLLSMNA